ncbi:S26 family signal peptidase [Mycolicibacterium litorale]|nr:S26 family signal peptidase [Mycolicibacterium litorale]
MRRFVVVEDSMRPALRPGDGLLSWRGGAVRRGQVRVFPDPTLPSRWLVKRVGEVRGRGRSATFEARSDNPHAPGVVDSRQFGWVPAAGSYRVLWTVRGVSPGR